MSEPRALTPEEMRAEMFGTMAALLKYWRDLPNPFIPPGQTDLGARMEGFLFSLLVMFDGGNMGIPGLNIVPCPHEDDEAYCRDQGENWWTEKVINDTQMHEVFPWKTVR